MIATEIYHEELWTGFKDVYLENPYVWLTNETPLSLDLTIGPAQMKKSIIVELVREFPSELKALTESQPAQASELLPRVNLRAALDERNAAMLVGAYNASVIRRLEKGKPACADQPAPINQTIADLWKKGDPTSRATALAMSYCPAMPGHAPRVMKLLRKLESYCQSHKLEADGQLAPNCQLRDGDRD